MKFETLAIHAGQEPDPNNGAVMTPVYLTSTYMQDGIGKPRQGYEYSRTLNPRARRCRIVSQAWKMDSGIGFRLRHGRNGYGSADAIQRKSCCCGQ